MGTAGNELLKNIDAQELIDTLDGFYCYCLQALQWSLAVLNRLEGQAAFMLTEQLEKLEEQSLKHAKRVAERIAELGGAVTGDPARLAVRSPTKEFALPTSTAEVSVILRYALEQTRVVIESYGALLDRTRGRDELTHTLALKLLKHEVAREAELEAALA
jgi:ferritin-like protein